MIRGDKKENTCIEEEKNEDPSATSQAKVLRTEQHQDLDQDIQMKVQNSQNQILKVSISQCSPPSIFFLNFDCK